MRENSIVYFKEPGKENTGSVIKKVIERIEQGDINYIVIASSSGETALKLLDKIKKDNMKVIVVGLHAGFRGGDQVALSDNVIKEIEEKGGKVFIGSHALSGVGRSISNKFGGTTPTEIIAHTLRTFCGHGIKVAVEVTIMAADAGLVPTTENIIAIGGTHGGADAAIVLKPAHMNNFFDMEIREILAKPLLSEK